jgi:hypothetical protein
VSHVVTIHTVGPLGGPTELKVEISGADAGTLTVKSWNHAGADPASKPDKLDVVQLYHGRLSADLMSITCRAYVIGPDPLVTCALQSAPAGGKSITVDVKGTFGGWGDRTQSYALSEGDYTSIRTFLADSGLPKA